MSASNFLPAIKESSDTYQGHCHGYLTFTGLSKLELHVRANLRRMHNRSVLPINVWPSLLPLLLILFLNTSSSFFLPDIDPIIMFHLLLPSQNMGTRTQRRFDKSTDITD